MLTRTEINGQGVELGFISRSSPAPAFINPEPARYNIKLGDMRARFRGSLQTEFIDNIYLSENDPQADIALNPNLKIGFVYPLSVRQLLEFNLGLGYRWYVDHSELAYFTIDPTSSIDYKLTIAGEVEVRLYDTFGLQADPLSRTDITGTGAGSLEFRRFNNTAGTVVSWQPTSDFRFSAGYSYSISRSLSDRFAILDQDSHTFSTVGYYTASPRLTLGALASVSYLEFPQSQRNDGISYNFGPLAIYRPTQFLTVNVFAGYSVLELFQSNPGGQTGLDGFTANAFIEHRLNSRITHDLRLSHGTFLSVNGVFNELFVAQYGILVRVATGVSVRATAMYEMMTGAGAVAEEASRQLYYIGTGYQLVRKWSVNVGYTFATRDSNLAGRGYTQNRLSVDLTREF